MLFSLHFFSDGQCLSIILLRFLIISLVSVHISQIVIRHSRIRMLFSLHFFSNGQCLPMILQRFLIIALVIVHIRKIVVCHSSICMLFSQHFFSNGQCLSVIRKRFFVVSLVIVHIRKIVICHSSIWMFFSQHFFSNDQCLHIILQRFTIVALGLVHYRKIVQKRSSINKQLLITFCIHQFRFYIICYKSTQYTYGVQPFSDCHISRSHWHIVICFAKFVYQIPVLPDIESYALLPYGTFHHCMKKETLLSPLDPCPVNEPLQIIDIEPSPVQNFSKNTHFCRELGHEIHNFLAFL